jgi:leucyl aminopeptidase (aminopeptidase T)
LLPGARRIVNVCAAVQPGERVVIVTDIARPVEIAAALAEAAREAGGAPIVITTLPTRSGDEPPSPVAAALASADVILAPTTGALYHSAAVRNAASAGARFVGLTAYTVDVLLRGGVFADFQALAPTALRLTELLTRASQARVVAPGGTDLTVDLTGRAAVPITGLAHRRGERTACPDIESFIAPIETSANGVVVVDASASIIGVVSEPIRIRVENGRAIEFSGDGVERIEAALSAAATPSAYTLAEFAFGLNPDGVIRGVIVEDEGVAGTGHVALGSNSFFGGTSVAPIHLDFVYRSPTLWLDDVLVIENGVFLP